MPQMSKWIAAALTAASFHLAVCEPLHGLSARSVESTLALRNDLAAPATDNGIFARDTVSYDREADDLEDRLVAIAKRYENSIALLPSDASSRLLPLAKRAGEGGQGKGQQRPPVDPNKSEQVVAATNELNTLFQKAQSKWTIAKAKQTKALKVGDQNAYDKATASVAKYRGLAEKINDLSQRTMSEWAQHLNVPQNQGGGIDRGR